MKTFIVEVILHTDAPNQETALYDAAKVLLDAKLDGYIKDYDVKYITEAWKDEK